MLKELGPGQTEVTQEGPDLLREWLSVCCLLLTNQKWKTGQWLDPLGKSGNMSEDHCFSSYVG